jgi:hypothetical protein
VWRALECGGPPQDGFAVANSTPLSGIRGLKIIFKKSIDTLLRVQLKDAPSLAFARSAKGRTTTGKK